MQRNHGAPPASPSGLAGRRIRDKFYEGGQAFYWAPGHAPIAETDCEYVDFSPTEEFTKVIRHISGQA